MNDPRRLRDEGDAFERALFSSLRLDEPTNEERRRVLSALGVVALPLAIDKTPGAPANAANATKAAAGSSTSGLLASVNALAGIVGLSAAVVVAATWTHPIASPPPEAPHAPHAPHAIAARPPVTTIARTPEPPPPEVEHTTARAQQGQSAEAHRAEAREIDVTTLAVLPSSGTPAPETTKSARVAATPEDTASPSAASAPSDQTANFTEEIELLDRVRASLAKRDSTQALALLDRHASAPHALADEALVLRVQALAQSGKPDEAMRLARAFLREHPRSPLALRLRRIVLLLEPNP